MAEYIEREEAIRFLSNPITMSMCLKLDECKYKRQQRETDLELIKSLPTADVQPVKHGRWVELDYDKSFCKCSECGVNWEWNIIFDCNFNYCPSCGAIMDGGDVK